MNSTTVNRRGGQRAISAALLLCCAAVDAAPAIRSTPGNKEKHMASPALEHYTQDLVLGQVQLAFYAGWPNVFSAMPVFKEVFAKRHTQ